jgi:hypothetical protein
VVRTAEGPVAGALVSIRGGHVGDQPSTSTDADGRFTLAAVPCRPVELEVFDHDVVKGGSLTPERPVDNWLVEVAAPPGLRGRVLLKGAPVAGAAVFGGMGVAETDEQGWFLLSRVSPGPVALNVEVRGMSREETVDYQPGMPPVTLELEENGSISGQLVDERGLAMVGRVVAFWPLDRKTQWGAAAGWGRTGEGGFFHAELTGEPRGRYRITVSTGWSSAIDLEPARPYPVVEIQKGSRSLQGVRVAATKPISQLRGRVLDSEGGPVSDVEVRVSRGSWAPPDAPRALTDAAGAFAFEGLPAGRYHVFARSGDGPRAAAQAETGHAVELRLPSD